MLKIIRVVAICLVASDCTRCQVSFSLGKPTSQSSTFDRKGSNLAVDGDISTCSVAGIGSQSVELAWWRVDLGGWFDVWGIAIVNTLDYYECQFLNKFSVYVSSNGDSPSQYLCITFDNPTGVGRGETVNLTCNEPIHGSSVTIKRFGGFRNDALSLCEVFVYARSLLFFETISGPTVARPISARQSSTFSNFEARLAIDGNPQTCSVAGIGSQSVEVGWIQLDFGETLTFYSVEIISATNPYESRYLSEFYIFIGPVDNVYLNPNNRICNSYKSSFVHTAEKISLRCYIPISGRYLTVRRTDGGFRQDALSVCEIQAFTDPGFSTANNGVIPEVTVAIPTTTLKVPTTSIATSILTNVIKTSSSTTTSTTMLASLTSSIRSNTMTTALPVTMSSTTSTTTSMVPTNAPTFPRLSSALNTVDRFKIFPKYFGQSDVYGSFGGASALDGDPLTCAIIGQGEGSADVGWFRVYFEVTFAIQAVSITNTIGPESVYLNNFEVLIGGSGQFCGRMSGTVNPGATITISCTEAIYGDQLLIRKFGGFRQDALVICELQVWAEYSKSNPLIVLPIQSSDSSGRLINGSLNSCSMIPPGVNGISWFQADFGLFYHFLGLILSYTRGSTESQFLTNLVVTIGHSPSPIDEMSLVCFTNYGPVFFEVDGKFTKYCENIPILGKYMNIRKLNGDTMMLCDMEFIVGSPEPICPETHFHCHSGYKCIEKSKLCNDVDDCGDMSDERNCTCMPGLLKCPKVNKCIFPFEFCDGIANCKDSTDELNCTCTSKQFRCSNGKCIAGNYYCDNIIDCTDLSDENNCTCTTGQVRCVPTSTCISKTKVCDRIKNCPDSSDELNCTCFPHEYKCLEGRCINRDWLCDGIKDCPFGDDEDEPQCDTCPPVKFKCFKLNQCVNISQRCNGVVDCPDSSDEAHCLELDNSTSRTDFLKVTLNGESGLYVCSTGWTYQHSLYACTCMGQNASASTFFARLDYVAFVKIKSNAIIADNVPVISLFEKSSSCESGAFVGVSCQIADCGLRGVTVDPTSPYIINGDVAAPGAWPWQVQLFCDGIFCCGGSIIQNNWILTAAHCVADRDGRGISTGKIIVKLGTNLLDDPNSKGYQVAMIVLHPDFAPQDSFNDIALLKLSTRITFTNLIKPICLPDKSITANAMNSFRVCIATGFGRTDAGSTSSKRLMQGRMNLMTYDVCVSNLRNLTRSYESYFKSQLIDKTMLCAGSPPTYAGTNSCKGDSGGPLVCRDSYDKWTQLGISSFSFATIRLGICTNSIFTRVSAFSEFIHSTTQEYG